MLEGARAVVTGGAGFIGSHVAERLASKNDVVVFDRTPENSALNLAAFRDRVTYVQGDVRNPEDLDRAVRGAAVVFHLAALASVPESFRDPVVVNDVNVHGTLHVLRAAKNAGARRVVFASSSAVYGANSPPLREDAPLDLLSPYAVSKAAGELWCRLYHDLGLEAVGLRLFNVYGPRQRAEGAYGAVVPKFLDAVSRGEPVTIYGDGEQTRDFVYVGDVGEAFDSAATANGVSGEVINVGTGESITVNRLLALVANVLGKDARTDHRQARPGDIRESYADPAKAKRLLGFHPRTDLSQGLRTTASDSGYPART